MHKNAKLFSEIYTFDHIIAFDTQIKVNFNTNSQFFELSWITYYIGSIFMQTMYRIAAKPKSHSTLYFYEPQRITKKEKHERNENESEHKYLVLHESI